jgi:hypothetical protein
MKTKSAIRDEYDRLQRLYASGEFILTSDQIKGKILALRWVLGDDSPWIDPEDRERASRNSQDQSVPKGAGLTCGCIVGERKCAAHPEDNDWVFADDYHQIDPQMIHETP